MHRFPGIVLLAILKISRAADFECNFETDFCGFTQVNGATQALWGLDQLDWSRARSSNPDPSTGPDSDHTLDLSDGFYAFLDVQPPQGDQFGSAATIVSPSFNIVQQSSCLRFWYHMRGNSVASLFVNVISSDARREVFRLAGNRGRFWNQASATLNVGTERFSFSATVGGRQGEIAIDDLSVRDGPCEGPPPGCPDSLCQNGGICVFHSDLFCQCSQQWGGRYCESRKDICDATLPCQNGGTCSIRGNGYHCSCKLGFSGVNCQMGNSQSCLSQPCLNGGYCKENPKTLSFWCVCPEHYTGKHCGRRRFGEHLPLRLAGPNALEGRVEVFYRNQWGTVCTDGFDDLAAQTACLQLGYKGRARAIHDLRYRAGSGNIWLDGVGCDYTYDNLKYCCHNEFGLHDCTHDKDVGVQCLNDSSIPLGDYTDFQDGTGGSTTPPPVTPPTSTKGRAIYGESLVRCNFDDSCDMEQSMQDSSNLDWIKQIGETQSWQTGPKGDHTLETGKGPYIYVEASGRYPGDKAGLVSPVLPYDVKCLVFWYHMKGSDMGTLNVYIIRAQEKKLLWTVTGEKGDRWIEVKKDIPASYNRIEIEGVVGKSYKSDIAIDDLVIVRSLCADYQGVPSKATPSTTPKRTTELTTGTPETTPQATTNRRTQPPTPTTQPAPETTQSTEPSTSPSTREPLPPTTSTDETTSSTASPSTASSTPSTALPPTTTFPPVPGSIQNFGCSFLSTSTWDCGELEQQSNDDLDWTLLCRAPRSRGSGTGPPRDHSGSGCFVYTEASTPATNGDKAVLRTPLVVGGGLKCLDLWYHMYGSNMGTLNIYTLSRDRSQRIKVWTQTGDQLDRWINLRLTISAVNFYLEIEGIIGPTYSSDMALDDIQLKQGACFDFSQRQICTFEDEATCFMNQLHDADIRWKQFNKETYSELTGPSSGAQGSSYFLYLEASDQPPGATALLQSPLLPPAPVRCFSFYYHMYGDSMGGINVFTVTTDKVRKEIFSRAIDLGNQWNNATIDITETSRAYYILIEGVRGPDYRSDLAIDQITLSPSRCS